MMNSLSRILTDVSGRTLTGGELALKVQEMMSAGIFLLLFCATFFFLYKKYFWQSALQQRVFFVVIIAFLLIMGAKFGIWYAVKGYIIDRLFFYAIPSPKFSSIAWAVVAALSVAYFFLFRKKAEQWRQWKFLFFLWFIFVTFSLGIAGMRLGSFGIYEPLTRIGEDYATDVQLVQSIPQFLHDYTALNQKLSLHGKIHPPGFALVLFLLMSVFPGKLLAVAIGIVLLGGTFLFSIYAFWRHFLEEEDARSAVELFLFTPSIVMFGATAMDILFLAGTWAALALVFAGWKRHSVIAAIGGVAAGVSLLFNFLFTLFGPIFLYFWVYLWQHMPHDRRRLLLRTFWSLAGFVAFFVFLFGTTGYSIVENFFVAHAAQYMIVTTNFTSVAAYVIYAAINIAAFSFFLGVPNAIVLLQGARAVFVRQKIWQILGFLLAIFLVVSGLFQGEIERIWLFITPLFLPAIYTASKTIGIRKEALICLLILQIVITQVLWYTYW